MCTNNEMTITQRDSWITHCQLEASEKAPLEVMLEPGPEGWEGPKRRGRQGLSGGQWQDAQQAPQQEAGKTSLV